ncbi:hypothetical protein APUTEX25_001117, partial [Auxenochlorella protothecoides]
DSPVFPPNFFESCPWSIQNDFQSLKEVGKGKDTVIYSAVCLPLGNKIVAVKIYDKSRLASTKVRAIKREVAMMLYFMRHRYPNVVELYGAFEDESRYFIVMEYCSVGTVEYMAPEVIALPPVDAVVSGQVRASEIPPNTEKVDIWALGVTFFELVTGRLPFEGKDKLEIKTNITEYRMSGFGPHVSAQCQDLIRSMLAYDPADRPSAEELLQHSFLALYRNKGAAPAFESSLGGSSSPGPSVRLGRLKSWSRASSTVSSKAGRWEERGA